MSFDTATAYTVTHVVSSGFSGVVSSTTLGTQGFSVSPRSQVTLAYGSSLYKVGNYNLWDADKVAGCVCDDGFTGYDCSSMKCPVGADPLDVTGEDKVNSHSASSLTVPSTYTKQNERQMLTMDSSRGALSGTFSLTFTSLNGEKKTTTSIATAPQLSSTVSVSGVEEYDLTYCTQANGGTQESDNNYGGAQETDGIWPGAFCEKLVRFTPDLPDDELALNDYIRIGNEIRQVTKLTRSTDSGNYSSAFVTAQFNQAYAAGTYAYRHTAEKAIEYGLEHLSNDVVGEVTAKKTLSSGNILFNTVSATAMYLRNSGTGGSTVTFSGSGGFGGGAAGIGDILRVHSHKGMSQIEAVADSHAALSTGFTVDPHWLTNSADTSLIGSGSTLAEIPIIDNGFKYRIKFEDNSGDIPDLVCNTNNLRSVYRMDEAAYVSRDEPDRVYFVDTKQGNAQPAYSPVTHADMTHPSAVSAGGTIYVGEQRCDVISSDADNVAGLKAEGSGTETYHSASVVCAQALSENSHSTSDAIVTHDPIEVLFEGSSQSCSSTDRPALRFIHDLGTASSSNLCADATSCASVLEYNGQNRLVRWASGDTIAHLSTHELMDNTDIAVNDRVSIRTSNDHTYETRTVDYINLQGLGSSTDNFFTVSQPFTAPHEEKRIFLNFKGTTSSAACSGRGLCDGSTAECQCFKGYTGQACQIQNALAA